MSIAGSDKDTLRVSDIRCVPFRACIRTDFLANRSADATDAAWMEAIYVRIIPNELLSSSDLIIDAVYEGGASGNAADDPISKVLQGVGNQGGFRAAGRGEDRTLVVLYTSG